MRPLKVVLVGDTKVGKSCILSSFVNGTFDRNMPVTIGAAFLTKAVATDTGLVRLQLWDTAGQERFRSLAPMYYRTSDVAILVYDVTSRDSLEGLREWAGEIADKAPTTMKTVVVGNKIDLVDQRVVTWEIGEAFAESIQAVHYGETSAMSGDGIKEVFNVIAELNATHESLNDLPDRQITGSDQDKKECC